MIQLSVVSDGTREGTQVLLPYGEMVAGVVGVDYSFTSDGQPLVSIHLVGVKTDIHTSPELLECSSLTLDELITRQRSVNAEIIKRKGQQNVTVQVPFVTGMSTVSDEQAKTQSFVSHGRTSNFESMLLPEEQQLLPEDPS